MATKPYKTPRRLSAVNAAYFAGLVDGEGTISLTRRHAGDNRQLVISIANTEPAILRWALDTTGVGKITRKRTSQPHHTPSFTYSVANRQALGILKQITPYLRSYKRERARLALVNYVAMTPRNGRYTRNLAKAREQFIARFLAQAPRAGRPELAGESS